MIMRFKWTFIASSRLGSNISNVSRYLALRPILPSSEIFVISYINSDTYQFQRVHRPAMDQPLIFQNIKHMSSNANLHGMKLRSISVLSNENAVNTFRNYR